MTSLGFMLGVFALTGISAGATLGVLGRGGAWVLESILWLEEWLGSEFKGALLMTCHDREFLNRIVTRIIEVAGGAATTGHENILDIEPVDIHQRVPLIFGSVHEVRLLEHYYREAHPYQERSQLFGNRGLFRSS